MIYDRVTQCPFASTFLRLACSQLYIFSKLSINDIEIHFANARSRFLRLIDRFANNPPCVAELETDVPFTGGSRGTIAFQEEAELSHGGMIATRPYHAWNFSREDALEYYVIRHTLGK